VPRKVCRPLTSQNPEPSTLHPPTSSVAPLVLKYRSRLKTRLNLQKHQFFEEQLEANFFLKDLVCISHVRLFFGLKDILDMRGQPHPVACTGRGRMGLSLKKSVFGVSFPASSGIVDFCLTQSIHS